MEGLGYNYQMLLAMPKQQHEEDEHRFNVDLLLLLKECPE